MHKLLTYQKSNKWAPSERVRSSQFLMQKWISEYPTKYGGNDREATWKVRALRAPKDGNVGAKLRHRYGFWLDELFSRGKKKKNTHTLFVISDSSFCFILKPAVLSHLWLWTWPTTESSILLGCWPCRGFSSYFFFMICCIMIIIIVIWFIITIIIIVLSQCHCFLFEGESGSGTAAINSGEGSSPA